MTSFESEMNMLIQSYLKEYKRQELTLEEIDRRPRYKRVWFWWMAMAHFNINHHYRVIELVPRELKYMHIVNKKMNTLFTWEKGKYVVLQEMDYDTCKKIYGI